MSIRSASPRRATSTRVGTTLGILALALVLWAAGPRDGFAQEPAPNPQETPAAAPTQAAAQQEPILPLSPIEQAEKNGTALPLSLKDLTKIALQNNLDIAISDTNEELYNQRILQTYGPYDPILTFTPGVQRRKSANTRLDTAAKEVGAGFNQTDQAYWNFGYTQAFATGGSLRASMNSNRSDTNQAFALFTPQYSTNWVAEFTQPLWRNFRIDQNRGNIRLANLDLKLNDSQFKQKVTETISRIQGLYWDLVGTIRDYAINRESVRLAQISLANNRKKVEIGTLAPIAITEAQAELASREVNLIVAAQKINTVQNNLRNLISSDRRAEIWRQTIVPTDTPDFREYKVDLEQSIDTALANRPELEQLATRMEQNDIQYSMFRDRKKWQLDFIAQFGTSGVAGPQTISEQGVPLIRPELVGGPAHAYRTMFSEGFTNWFFGVQMQIPLGNRGVESQMAQVKIQNRQNLMNRRVTEQLIQTEIRNAAQTIDTNRQQVETAKVARQLAEEQLVGEEKRFQAGLSENFRVLDRQRSLSQAQGVELQALIAYKKSIIDLQKAMYTLLESNDFEIAKTSSDSVNVPPLK